MAKLMQDFIWRRNYHLVSPVTSMQIGDVLIQGGSPGHAVIVVDMAENPATGEKLYLLAQSYMPAQDIQWRRKSVINLSDAPSKGEGYFDSEWDLSATSEHILRTKL